MGPLLWCVVGAGAGWIAGVPASTQGLAGRVENVVVGIFGAFIGGEFLASFVDGAAATGFRPASLALAVGGAISMLVLLALMRRVVGPMRPHKVRRKTRS